MNYDVTVMADVCIFSILLYEYGIIAHYTNSALFKCRKQVI